MKKSVKSGLICAAALAVVATGSAVAVNAANNSVSSNTSTDVATGATKNGNAEYFWVTAPKTVTVPVGTSADALKTQLGAFAQSPMVQ